MRVPLEYLMDMDTHSWLAAHSQGPEHQVGRSEFALSSALCRLNEFSLSALMCSLSGLGAMRLRAVCTSALGSECLLPDLILDVHPDDLNQSLALPLSPAEPVSAQF